jgi:predicted enzyme related to lactoylglutathione lyase
MPGPQIAAVTVADDAAAWAALGFSVTAGVCVLGATEVRFAGNPKTEEHANGGTGWTLRAPDGPAVIDGVATAWTLDAPATAGEHPNGAVSVDHVVLATPDVERTCTALVAAGMQLRTTRTAGQVRQAFFRHGEAIVEVAGPLEPSGDGPAELWGLTVAVADLGATAERVGDRMGRIKDAVQPGRRIATLKPGTLSVAVAFISA